MHIADYCMPRDDIQVYCQKHIPKKDVVVHKLIEDEDYQGWEVFPKKKKGRWFGRRAGWSMAVRYLKKPPREYGFTAVTPNVSGEHLAKVITKSQKSFWSTEWIRKNYKHEIKAVKETIRRISPLSPTQQVWRRYLLGLRGRKALKELSLPAGVLRDITMVFRRLKRRYKDLLGIILIGSFAEGNYRRGSDLDIVLVKKRKIVRRDLCQLTENAKRKTQIIPYRRKELEEHFKNSTTMAYAIQRGKIIYEKMGFWERYYKWNLGWPSSSWMERWFSHWQGIYDWAVKDFKKCQKRRFDSVFDSLPRAVVNFAILFLETRGFIPTTKIDIEKCFCKEIQDVRLKDGLRIALTAHHEDRDISLGEAGKVYLCGEFLKEKMGEYFREIKERKKRWEKP